MTKMFRILDAYLLPAELSFSNGRWQITLSFAHPTKLHSPFPRQQPSCSLYLFFDALKNIHNKELNLDYRYNVKNMQII